MTCLKYGFHFMDDDEILRLLALKNMLLPTARCELDGLREEKRTESVEKMSSALERYQKLGLRDSLQKYYRYPIACKELSFILREAFHQIPKSLQSIIFQDTLLAFRLLPEIETKSAVSAAQFLLQNVEATLPNRKKNVAVTEFKHAMVSHKRRSKAHLVEKGSLQLPQDILVHVFSFLDMKSLVSAGLVSR
ncbi:hypothetical protein ACSQ67_014135 [Phaseolus vulgaris]